MTNWITKWWHRNTVRIEPFENKRGKWQNRLVAWNGEILQHSEEYNDLQGCFKTIKMLEGKTIVTK